MILLSRASFSKLKAKRLSGRNDEGLSLVAIIHTFGSLPPFRIWLVIYTAYAATQLFGLHSVRRASTSVILYMLASSQQSGDCSVTQL